MFGNTIDSLVGSPCTPCTAVLILFCNAPGLKSLEDKQIVRIAQNDYLVSLSIFHQIYALSPHKKCQQNSAEEENLMVRKVRVQISDGAIKL